MRRWLVLAALIVPGAVGAQVPTRPPRRPPADTGAAAPPPHSRAGADTGRADTTRAPKELVEWAEPDSVMSALLARQGYVSTRYQGHRAAFDAQHRTLTLSGDGAVQREQMVLVSDTIVYNDSTKIVRAGAPPGDTIVLRDPAQGTSDLVALNSMAYDIVNRRGIARDLSTSSNASGQTWFLHSDDAAVHGDTTGKGQSVSYAQDGSITSCNLPYPHYHFAAKEIKMVSKRIMVARPAVLYIADIPVLWLPFIFQDMRSGRRSGLIPPRFGLSDIVRTSAGYTREIDDLGYYFAINDYMDATLTFDWRSRNGNTQGNLGWMRYNGEWRYSWLDRFLSGGIRSSYSTFSDGETNLGVQWTHQQKFSQNSSLNANVNYSSNTSAIRQQAYTVAEALATIASALNFQQTLGPTNFSIGGTRTQYSGRKEVDQNFPNFTVTTKPLNVTSWLLWSPGLSVSNTESMHMDVAPFRFVPTSTGIGFDSVQANANQRTTTVGFQTPLRIGGFTWQNSIQVNDHEEDFPRQFQILDINTGDVLANRVFARNFDTRVDWQTGISLPVLLQGSLKITPSVSIVNADPSLPFLARTTFSGGRFVHQSKVLQYTVDMAPTLFGFFPGFGPFTRIRHSIQPHITFDYAPTSHVSDDFLRAYNHARAGYPGGLARTSVSVGLNQVFEAKLHSQNDTNPDAGEKIKLLSLSTSPIAYDFYRHQKTGLSGFTTPTFNYRIASDLLPGFDLSVDYSLIQGDVQSDSARFKPFRTGITASFNIGRSNNPFTALARIFGNTTARDTMQNGGGPGGPGGGEGVGGYGPNLGPNGQGLDQRANIAGPMSSRYRPGINTSGGWNASISFSSTRTRPIAGAKEFDPRAFCQTFADDPFNFQRCLNQPPPVDTLDQRFGGGQIIVAPAQATLRGNVAFNLTPRWAMQWTTGYDFRLHDFSDQDVSLQRDMHDWRANLSFSRAPNGNFAFQFFIALKAEPDLKFDYHRSTNRPTTGSLPP